MKEQQSGRRTTTEAPLPSNLPSHNFHLRLAFPVRKFSHPTSTPDSPISPIAPIAHAKLRKSEFVLFSHLNHFMKAKVRFEHFSVHFKRSNDARASHYHSDNWFQLGADFLSSHSTLIVAFNSLKEEKKQDFLLHTCIYSWVYLPSETLRMVKPLFSVCTKSLRFYRLFRFVTWFCLASSK